MTPADKQKLWNALYKCTRNGYPGATYEAYDKPTDPRVRGGKWNWKQRDLRALFDQLVVYGDNNQPTAAWRELEKYKTKITPASLRSIYQSIVFFIPPPPVAVPTVITGTAGSVAITTATISNSEVTLDGGDTVTARGICYSNINNPPTITDSTTVNGSGLGLYNSNLTGLTANTNYFFSAYATNSSGTGYGAVDTFNTLPASYGPGTFDFADVTDYVGGYPTTNTVVFPIVGTIYITATKISGPIGNVDGLGIINGFQDVRWYTTTANANLYKQTGGGSPSLYTPFTNYQYAVMDVTAGMDLYFFFSLNDVGQCSLTFRTGGFAGTVIDVCTITSIP